MSHLMTNSIPGKAIVVNLHKIIKIFAESNAEKWF